MKPPSLALRCFSRLALFAAIAACRGIGHSETTILQIGIADRQSLEFTANTEVARVRLDARTAGSRLATGDGINPWLGHSRGAWGEAVRYQEFLLENCEPGRTYELRLKFHWASSPDTGFTAMHRGAQISSVVLTNQALGQFWAIPVVAQEKREKVELTHIYDLGQDPVHYAQLDYLELVAFDTQGGSTGGPSYSWGAGSEASRYELQIVQIGEGDLSNREFQGSSETPEAVIDLRNYGLIQSIQDFNGWLGHSRGPWGERVQYQRIRLRNCVPGTEYKLKLKFYDRNHPDVGFMAFRNGSQISSVVLNDQALSHYWVIPFQAQRTEEVVEISHIYQLGNSQTYYALLDYAEVTSIGDSRDFQGRGSGTSSSGQPRRRFRLWN